MPQILIGIAFVLISVLPKNPDYWRHQATWCFLAACVGIFLWLGKRYSYCAGALIAWCVVCGLRFFSLPLQLNPIYVLGKAAGLQQMDILDRVISFDAISAGAVAQLLLITISVMITRQLKSINGALSFLCIFNTFGVIIGYFMKDHGPYFCLDNPSLDGTLIAMLYPVMVFRPQVLKWRFKSWMEIHGSKCIMFWNIIECVAPLIAIVMTHSSVAWVTMAVIIASYLVKQDRRIWFALAGFGMIMLGGWWWLGKDFADSSGRMSEAWPWAWDFWTHGVDKFWGTGTGTLWIIADHIGAMHHRFGKPIFTTMHNDWFQVLFEQGLVGLTLAVIVFFQALWRSWDRPWLFSTIMGFGCLSCAQMFVHLALPSYIMGVLTLEALHARRY